MRQQISPMRSRHLAHALFLFSFCGLATVNAQTTQRVIPLLEEVTVNPTTGRATAYFGYHNPNAKTTTLKHGEPLNFMDPQPEVCGQPEQFLPGVRHYAFACVFDYRRSSRVTWYLDTLSATADSATAVPQPQTSIFTYQGRLTDGSTAASGTYPMQFALYDAASGGTQIGSTLTSTSISVSAGLFSVPLDFGSNPFTSGANRYLEIAVKRAGDTAYTTLTPRQQLTAAPFAIHTISASSADSLSNVCVGCVTSAQIGSVDASKVSGNVAGSEYAMTAITAGNVTGVVGIGNGGTGSSVKNFVDLSTNQSIGGNKTFTGVLSGDGSGLSNVAGKFPWQVVTGTSQQAQPNTGYVLITANPNQVVITLPANPNIGDIVRVSGAGAGGWKISQNAGQSITGGNLNLYGLSWTARESNRNWISVASSADGSKLVAIVFGGKIYTSTDSGVTWAERESSKDWTEVASSADGTKLVAVGPEGIYASVDSGVNWAAKTAVLQHWTGIASSADGTKLVAVGGMDSGTAQGAIYISDNSGWDWRLPEIPVPHQNWSGVASSADGTKLVAVALGGYIYTSTDSGLNWTKRDSARRWISVASSADGSKLVAVVSDGQIYTSRDSGVSWGARESNRGWSRVASSADGSKLVAVAAVGEIHTSTDSGATWTPRESGRTWSGVASSADGRKLVATVQGGQIYTSRTTTTLGTSGYLLGDPFAAIELQYLGGGRFLTLSHEGTITGNEN